MKYIIDYTSNYKKQRKKIIKQGKDISKLDEIVEIIATGKELDEKYKNHKLINDKTFKDCSESYNS